MPSVGLLERWAEISHGAHQQLLCPPSGATFCCALGSEVFQGLVMGGCLLGWPMEVIAFTVLMVEAVHVDSWEILGLVFCHSLTG